MGLCYYLHKETTESKLILLLILNHKRSIADQIWVDLFFEVQQ